MAVGVGEAVGVGVAVAVGVGVGSPTLSTIDRAGHLGLGAEQTNAYVPGASKVQSPVPAPG